MGSVYKVTDGENVYYGSTIKPINQRLSHHKTSSTNCCVTKYMNRDNLTIELVEEVEDVEQLLWRERYYVENNECVNKKIPIRTKEESLELSRKYNNINKEHIRQQRTQLYSCECGSVITLRKKSRHFKSKKHINFINE